MLQEDVADTGELLAVSTIHRSLEPAFEPFLPVHIGMVKLDCGPRLIAFVANDLAPGDRVQIKPMRNPLDQPTWQAVLLLGAKKAT